MKTFEQWKDENSDEYGLDVSLPQEEAERFAKFVWDAAVTACRDELSKSTLSKNEVVNAAIEAGFSPYGNTCLSGKSEDDRLVAVEEYPVGESVLKLAALIEAALVKRIKEGA